MTYAAKDYAKLLGMAGFSDTLLKNHFTLYQGYVTNTNKLLDTFAAMLKEGKVASPPSPEYAELKRRLGWEFNGMRLHELYFENLGGKKPLAAFPAVEKKLAAAFGSVADWEKDFRAAGTMRGIGWSCSTGTASGWRTSGSTSTTLRIRRGARRSWSWTSSSTPSWSTTA